MNGNKEALNVDLTTGQDIPFEKVFVSSAPINLLLGEGLYEELAWKRTIYTEREPYEYINDMDKVDMSDYEELTLILANNYKKLKENITYNIYPSKVVVYGLTDNIIESDYDSGITIEFLDNIEEIAIYKRYLTKNSIFENDNIGIKNLIVLTNILDSNHGSEYIDDYIKNISYGKIKENIFVNETMILMYDMLEEDEKTPEPVIEYIQKISENNQKTLKEETSKDKGVIAEIEYDILQYNEEAFYLIRATKSKATASILYFQNEAFRDYAKVKAYPSASVEMNSFREFMQEEFPNLEIEEKYEEYYISETGEFLGNTEEEAKQNIELEEDEDEETSNVIENEVEEIN